LAAFLLVLIAGGLETRSLFFLIFVVSITVVSWLYTPYIFNPYHFFYQQWWDFRHWWAFFFSDGGRQWFEWYQETQLKPMHGLRSTPFQVICWFFFFFSWYVVVENKVNLLTVLWSSEAVIMIVQNLMACPPLILIFTMVLPLWSVFWPGGPGASHVGFSNGRCCGRIPRTSGTNQSVSYKHWRFVPTRLRDGDETLVTIREFVLFEEGKEIKSESFAEMAFTLKEAQEATPIAIDFEEPRLIDSYSFRTARERPGSDPICWKVICSNDRRSWVTLHENKLEVLTPEKMRAVRLEPQAWHTFPPAGLRQACFVFIIIEIVEASLFLFVVDRVFRQTEIIIAGVLLKYAGLSSLLFATECLFRMRGSIPQTFLTKPLMAVKRGLKLWLMAHRMAADVAVSFLILSVLSIFVAYDYVQRVVFGCKSWSIHQLLVFRDPGHASATVVELPDVPRPSRALEMDASRSRTRLWGASASASSPHFDASQDQ